MDFPVERAESGALLWGGGSGSYEREIYKKKEASLLARESS